VQRRAVERIGSLFSIKPAMTRMAGRGSRKQIRRPAERVSIDDDDPIVIGFPRPAVSRSLIIAALVKLQINDHSRYLDLAVPKLRSAADSYRACEGNHIVRECVYPVVGA